MLQRFDPGRSRRPAGRTHEPCCPVYNRSASQDFFSPLDHGPPRGGRGVRRRATADPRGGAERPAPGVLLREWGRKKSPVVLLNQEEIIKSFQRGRGHTHWSWSPLLGPSCTSSARTLVLNSRSIVPLLRSRGEQISGSPRRVLCALATIKFLDLLDASSRTRPRTSGLPPKHRLPKTRPRTSGLPPKRALELLDSLELLDFLDENRSTRTSTYEQRLPCCAKILPPLREERQTPSTTRPPHELCSLFVLYRPPLH